MTRRQPTRRAFTLVELLVVIGIIGVLIGILLPTLGRARETARRTNCLSNLRQVGVVLRNYSVENQGYVPIGYRSGFKQFNSMVYSKTSGKFCLFGILYLTKHMDSPEIFFCPSNEDPQSNFNSETNPWPPVKGPDAPNQYAGYGFRPEYQLDDEFHIKPGSNPVPKMSAFEEKAILADLTAVVERVDRRHGTGINVLYGDGSGRWVNRVHFEEPLSQCTKLPSKDVNPYQDQIWAALDKQ